MFEMGSNIITIELNKCFSIFVNNVRITDNLTYSLPACMTVNMVLSGLQTSSSQCVAAP